MFNLHHTPHITGETYAWWQFRSQFLVHARDVLVWLPPGYHDNPHRRYPVLYAHDGQNLLDATTSFMGVKWNLDNVAYSMIQDGMIEPFIMVAVYNSPDRIPEYNPLAKGGEFGRFMVEEVMPAVNGQFRTEGGRCNALIGSSMGGLISFAHLWWYPQHFFGAACLSPSLWVLYRTGGAREWLERHRFPPVDTKLYLDHGTRGYEGRMRGIVEDVVHFCLERGLSKNKIRHHIARGGDHNEFSWAARVDKPLKFLFKG
jgi:enterochelin esterase-like enzyme